jgi:hypothetical protein
MAYIRLDQDHAFAILIVADVPTRAGIFIHTPIFVLDFVHSARFSNAANIALKSLIQIIGCWGVYFKRV